MKNVNEMSVSELSRWYALYEAVNLVGDECDERGINFETVNLEPLPLRKYIEKTSDIFARKFMEEQEFTSVSRKRCFDEVKRHAAKPTVIETV